jgi:dolichol kinase
MNIISTTGIGLLFLGFFVILETAKRFFRINPEFSRKAAHIAGGLAVIRLSPFLNRTEYLILNLIFLVIFILNFRRKILSSISGVARKTYGEITYICGLLFIGLVFFNRPDYFNCAILILAIPDAVAGLAGYRISKNSKTFAGFSVYCLISYLILNAYFPNRDPFLSAVILAIIEYITPLGFDNLTAPLAFTFLILL